MAYSSSIHSIGSIFLISSCDNDDKDTKTDQTTIANKSLIVGSWGIYKIEHKERLNGELISDTLINVTPNSEAYTKLTFSADGKVTSVSSEENETQPYSILGNMIYVVAGDRMISMEIKTLNQTELAVYRKEKLVYDDETYDFEITMFFNRIDE